MSKQVHLNFAFALPLLVNNRDLTIFDSGDVIDDITEKPTSGHFEFDYYHSFSLFNLGN